MHDCLSDTRGRNLARGTRLKAKTVKLAKGVRGKLNLEASARSIARIRLALKRHRHPKLKMTVKAVDQEFGDGVTRTVTLGPSARR